MNSSEEKFVFELKDLSFNDLISLYNDILDFHTYLDETYKSVSEEVIDSSNVAPEDEEITPEGESSEGNENEESSSNEETPKQEESTNNTNEQQSESNKEEKA